MYILFISLTIASIISQIPHAYWAINHFSQIEINWLKHVQNVVFCGIISIGIFGFVMIGKHWYAFFGAVVEIIINLYYYNNQFTGRGQSQLWDKFKKNWLAYFMAVLIPMMIFVFSAEIHSQRQVLDKQDVGVSIGGN